MGEEHNDIANANANVRDGGADEHENNSKNNNVRLQVQGGGLRKQKQRAVPGGAQLLGLAVGAADRRNTYLEAEHF